ncbi:MAG: hypothetical protein CMJ64_27550 [Planctomycetaceae bacterium]|nr:hypothetical protein [Planctomycetaceae bacterium]
MNMKHTQRAVTDTTPGNPARRQFLRHVGAGFTGLGLIDLLSRDGFFANNARAAEAENLLAPKPQHFLAKAKHCIFLFMNGGPSHVDTFDPKPALTKFDGKPYEGKVKVGSNNRPVGYLAQTTFKFNKHGDSGLPISDVFPHTAKHADDLCVIRSMWADTAAHASGCLQMNTGNVQIGSPSVGSWLSYGLGTESEDLPSYVVMTDPRGGPIGSASNWTAGYMPAAYQGTLFRSQGSPLLDLATPEGISNKTQRSSLDLLGELNRQHLREHPEESELVARIMSYELAYRMQSSATEAVNISAEDEMTKEMYGLNDKLTADFGGKCLIARRLIERGVRFVQLYSGGGHIEDTWDGHNDCISNHKLHGDETDKPIAALMTDLKQRGLWDETIIVWGGEFGRTPTSEGVGKPGRDHNWLGFSMWLAGAGVKGGQAIGATDELGFLALQDKVHVSDLHATILHLMGLDHRELAYFYNGLLRHLTGPEEERYKVVEKALA